MSFNVSGWSIRRPIPTLVLFLVLTLAGLVSVGRLGVDLNPNIDFPAVIVTVNQTGAGPEELETQVTKKVGCRCGTREYRRTAVHHYGWQFANGD